MLQTSSARGHRAGFSKAQGHYWKRLDLYKPWVAATMRNIGVGGRLAYQRSTMADYTAIFLLAALRHCEDQLNDTLQTDKESCIVGLISAHLMTVKYGDLADWRRRLWKDADIHGEYSQVNCTPSIVGVKTAYMPYSHELRAVPLADVELRLLYKGCLKEAQGRY